MKNVSRLQQARRHGETWTEPLSDMERSQEPNPRGIVEMGAVGQDIEGGLGVAERKNVAQLEGRQLEEEPLDGLQVGIGEIQMLVNDRRRLPWKCPC